MTGINIFRTGIWVMVVVLGAFLAYTSLKQAGTDKSIVDAGISNIGGPFSLVSDKGDKVTEASLVGHPSALFFGFTQCPDVCPATLSDASVWLQKLGADGDKLKVYFVSVDPERDTQELLSDYVGAFDPRIRALTGSVDQVAKIANEYRVFYRKVPLEDDDYTVEHNASVFLMDAKGKFFGTIAYGEDMDTAVQKLRRLISKG